MIETPKTDKELYRGLFFGLLASLAFAALFMLIVFGLFIGIGALNKPAPTQTPTSCTSAYCLHEYHPYVCQPATPCGDTTELPAL